MIMSSLGWAIVLVGVTLAGDVAWSEFRARKSRRDAERRGSTLTAKFGIRRH